MCVGSAPGASRDWRMHLAQRGDPTRHQDHGGCFNEMFFFLLAPHRGISRQGRANYWDPVCFVVEEDNNTWERYAKDPSLMMIPQQQTISRDSPRELITSSKGQLKVSACLRFLAISISWIWCNSLSLSVYDIAYIFLYQIRGNDGAKCAEALGQSEIHFGKERRRKHEEEEEKKRRAAAANS